MKYITVIKNVGLLTYVQLFAIAVAGLVVWVELNYDYEQLAWQSVKAVNEKQTSGFDANYSAILDGFITVQALQNYQEIAARPLFSQTRSPPVQEEPVVQAAVEKEPMDYSLKLNGVSIAGKAKTALVWHTTERKFYEVERGETVKNWKVREIKPDSVVLSQNGTNMELLLWEEPKKTQ
jgi:type II secretory pathway component PulC